MGWRFEIYPPLYKIGDEVYIIGEDRVGIISSYTCEVEVGHTGEKELLRPGVWKYHVKVGMDTKTFLEHDLQISSKMAQRFKTAVDKWMEQKGWDWERVGYELRLKPGDITTKLNQIEYYPDLATAIVRLLGMPFFDTLNDAGFTVEVKGTK